MLGRDPEMRRLYADIFVRDLVMPGDTVYRLATNLQMKFVLDISTRMSDNDSD